MKKILLTLATASLLTFGMQAQKSNVNHAKTKALSIENPDFNEAKSLIGSALINEETKDQAKTLWTAGLVYEKSSINNYKLKTVVAEEQAGKDMVKAYDYYMQAYKLDQEPNKKGKIKPKYTSKIKKSMILMYKQNYLVNYAVVLNNSRNYKSAFSIFEKHLSIPDLEFVKESKDAIEKDTTYTTITYYAAACAWSAEMPDKALELFKSIKDKGYEENRVYQSIYQIEINANDSAASLNTLKEGVQKFPNEFFFLGNLINYYVQTNQTDVASKYLDEAIVKNPDNAQLYNVKGSMYEVENELDSALMYFEKSLAMADSVAEYHMSVGRIYYNEGVEADKHLYEQNLKGDEFKAAKKAVDDLFLKSLPYFEDAVKLDSTNITNISTLRSVYYRFSYNRPDSEQYKAKYDELTKLKNSL